MNKQEILEKIQNEIKETNNNIQKMGGPPILESMSEDCWTSNLAGYIEGLEFVQKLLKENGESENKGE